MLINNNDDMNTHVKFVNYTGRYPNLCSGILTLEIDGLEYTFGYGTNHYPFWTSGGGLKCNYEGAYQNEWQIDVEALPEQFRKYAGEIDKVFNSNVRWGCCGGCI